MKYIFKPKNRIECISRNGDYHGFFTIKNIELVISAKNPRHLQVLMKFRHKIEEEFDTEIPDADAEKVVTVGDVVDYIKDHVE